MKTQKIFTFIGNEAFQGKDNNHEITTCGRKYTFERPQQRRQRGADHKGMGVLNAPSNLTPVQLGIL